MLYFMTTCAVFMHATAEGFYIVLSALSAKKLHSRLHMLGVFSVLKEREDDMLENCFFLVSGCLRK